MPLRRPLLLALLVLVGAEVIVRVTAQWLPEPQVWPTYETQVKIDQMDELRGRGVPVVTVGSSLMDVGFEPSLLDRSHPTCAPAYNSSLAGVGTDVIDVWASRIVVPRLHPATVVIGLSSRELNTDAPDQDKSARTLLRSRPFRRALGQETTLDRVNDRLERWSELFRYRTVFRQPLNLARGRGLRDPTENVLAGGQLDAPGLHHPYGQLSRLFVNAPTLQHWELSEARLAGLRDLVRRLRDMKVGVAVVNMPVTDDWIAAHGRGRDDYDTATAAMRLAAQDGGARFVDAGVWDRGLFADPVHLNARGSVRFTALMGQVLGHC